VKTNDTDAYWTGSYDALMEYRDDTSDETTALAVKLLVRQDRASGLLPRPCNGWVNTAAATIGTRPSRRRW